MAGFFDGEGCINISISGKSHNPCLRVMIVNTDQTILSIIHQKYGGRMPSPKSTKPNWKPFRQIILTGHSAVQFLLKIRHLVIVKKPQVELALEFWEFQRRPKQERCFYVESAIPRMKGRVVAKLKAETIAKELEFKNRMHVLNRKGLPLSA
jgi:hypothetical protein